MKDSGKKVICAWGKRHSLEINGGEVHGCPLRARSSDGAIALSDCKYCTSHVKIIEEGEEV